MLIFPPVIIKRFLQLPVLYTIGIFDVPAGIVTSIDKVGTIPSHQLAASFQLLVMPSQSPMWVTITVVVSAMSDEIAGQTASDKLLMLKEVVVLTKTGIIKGEVPLKLS